MRQVPEHALHTVPVPASVHVPVSISSLALQERTQEAPQVRYWSRSISAPIGTLGQVLWVLRHASLVVLPAGAKLPTVYVTMLVVVTEFTVVVSPRPSLFAPAIFKCEQRVHWCRKTQRGKRKTRDSLSRHRLHVDRLVALVADEKVPDGHSSHLDAPPTEYLPAGQMRQEVAEVAPAEAAYLPATHGCVSN